jgi:hypothetical protein
MEAPLQLMKSFRLLAGISALFVLAAPLSRAQIVIYDNIGNGNSFTTQTGWTVGGPGQFETAVRFFSPFATLLDSADLALFHTLAGTPSVNVALLSDSGFNTPGVVIETTAVALPQIQIDLTTPLTHVEFSNASALVAGTYYWLAVSPADTTTFTAWEITGRPFGLVAQDVLQIGFSDPWSTTNNTSREGGMRIFGVAGPTPVPEPSTYGLIGSALLVAGIGYRRYRKQG